MKKTPTPSLDSYHKSLRNYEKVHPMIRIELPPTHLIAIIGALQLAIRHPSFPERLKTIITNFIHQTADHINEPVITRVIKLGFDERYDK